MLNLTPLARSMRNAPTDAEYKLWYHLSRKQLGGLKFRRQVPIENYIVDFLCFEKRLIIELDGGQHSEEDVTKRDKERTDFLESKGFLILRFWNTEIFENIEGVLQTIVETIHPHLNPPPQGEEVKARREA